MIKFLDLNKLNQRFESEFQDKLKNMVSDGQFILGEEVDQFENSFADYCGVKHCVGVANGMDALTLIFKAYINLGLLKPQDGVMVPANTFMASVLSILNCGLRPVLVEPDESSFNLSVHGIKKAINSNVKAIMVVHLYGQLAPMEKITEFSKKNNLILIEDAAQAHGAENRQGIKPGNLSDAAAFSFYPAKNLGALGDAGAVTTNNSDVADQIRLLRNYGSSKKYEFKIAGFNSRLDALQAAFLRVKLPFLDSDNERRRQIAKRYLRGIKNERIGLPTWDGSNNHVFYVFVVRVDKRDDFEAYLEKNEIGYLIHYPKPPHLQPALKDLVIGNFPITERIHETVVSLPMNPILTDEEVEKVIQVVNNW